MNIPNRRRFRRGRAVAVTFIVSRCAHLTPLTWINALATARVQQRESISDSTHVLEPRGKRFESPNEAALYASSDGPLVRVALMTDIASTLINCSSGLAISRSIEGFRAH